MDSFQLLNMSDPTHLYPNIILPIFTSRREGFKTLENSFTAEILYLVSGKRNPFGLKSQIWGKAPNCLPAIRVQHNRNCNSIANLSLLQTHSLHGQFFWEHGISSSRQEDGSSSSHSLPTNYDSIRISETQISITMP